MFSASLKQQVLARWREFRREPSALYWVIFMPIFWMVVLGFAFSDPKPERYVVGLEATMSDPQVEVLRSALGQDQQIVLLERKVRGEENAVHEHSVLQLILWPDKAEFHYDPARPEAVRARQHINGVLQHAAGRIDVFPVVDRYIEENGQRYIDFLVPGLLALTIMTTSLFGVGMTIVSNRKENLLKRYMVTPMPPFEYLLSHWIGRMMSFSVEFVAVMMSAYLIFGFVVEGSLVLFLCFALIGTMSFTSISTWCASRSRSLPYISGVSNLINIILLLFSGVFFAKTNFPEWLIPAINLLPLTALVDALRSVALNGNGLAENWGRIGLLGLYAILGLVMTRLRFRWY